MSLSRNFLYNILQTVSAVLFPLVTFPYATRILGPEGIGTANFVENFCRYFMTFAALGIPIYGVREISKFSESISDRSKVFFEIIFINIITTIICLCIYLSIIYSFSIFEKNIEMYMLGIIYLFFNVFSVEWFFNGLSEFKFIALRSLLIRFLFIILLFAFVRDKDDVYWYFALNVFTLIINNIVNILFIKDKIIFNFNNISLKKHLKPLLYIFSSTVAISLYIIIDVLILGLIADEKSVGYYSLGTKISKVPLALILALGAVIIPELNYAKSKNDLLLYQSLLNKSIDFVIMTGIPVGMFIYICSQELIMLFGGKDFAEATTSLKIMAPLAVVIGFSNVFGIQILTVFNKEKQLLYTVTLGMIVSVILNFLLIPYLLDKGSAIANLLSELSVTIFGFLLARKCVQLNNPLLIILKHLLCYLPIFFISSFFEIENIIISLILHGIIFLVIFLITNIYLFKSEFLLSILNKKYI